MQTNVDLLMQFFLHLWWIMIMAQVGEEIDWDWRVVRSTNSLQRNQLEQDLFWDRQEFELIWFHSKILLVIWIRFLFCLESRG